MAKFIVLFLFVAGTAALAEESGAKEIARMSAADASLAKRLHASDRVAEMLATGALLDAWVAGDPNLRATAPTCFHAIGVRGLGDALTAMSAEDPTRRAAGAVLMGSIGPDARLGVRKLIIGLADESELVRRESARALGNIGSRATDAIPGLVALIMQDEKLALDALQAMTRITLDAQLAALRTPPVERIAQLVDVAHSWLRFSEQPDGDWGDAMTDALVLLAFLEGGIADVNRPAVHRALRRLILDFADSKEPPPLIAAILFMAWRETRDPLYLTIGTRLVERLNVSATDGAVTSNLHSLALKQAQWAGEAVDARIWASVPATAPVLLGRVLRPGNPDTVTEDKEAARMLANPLKWEPKNERWEPRYLVREAWALNLLGGEARDRYRESFFQAVFPKILPSAVGEPPTARHWEPPGGNNANPISTTAAITAVLRMCADQYPPRLLPFPRDAKHRMAVHALNGARKHPDPLMRAYAESMITLWSDT